MRHFLISIIDWFYPPFRRLMSKQTFRYAACGGGNTVLGLFVFYISFYYIFDKQIIDLGFYAFEPHSLALIVSGLCSFIVGFVLNKFVVFTLSYLKGRVQLFRYALSFVVNLVLNYFMLILLVEKWHWEPVMSQVITIACITVFSYLSQKHFTFHTKAVDR